MIVTVTLIAKPIRMPLIKCHLLSETFSKTNVDAKFTMPLVRRKYLRNNVVRFMGE
jgi:hypothetical protein